MFNSFVDCETGLSPLIVAEAKAAGGSFDEKGGILLPLLHDLVPNTMPITIAITKRNATADIIIIFVFFELSATAPALPEPPLFLVFSDFVAGCFCAFSDLAAVSAFFVSVVLEDLAVVAVLVSTLAVFAGAAGFVFAAVLEGAAFFTGVAAGLAVVAVFAAGLAVAVVALAAGLAVVLAVVVADFAAGFAAVLGLLSFSAIRVSLLDKFICILYLR